MILTAYGVRQDVRDIWTKYIVYVPIVGSVVRETDRSMGGLGFESRRRLRLFNFSAINSEHNEPKTFLNVKVINDWNYKSFSVRVCLHHTATNTQQQTGTGIDRSNTSHLTLWTLRSKLNSHLSPLFIHHRSSGEKLIKYQSDTSCVIMSFIFMTTPFYKALMFDADHFQGLKG